MSRKFAIGDRVRIVSADAPNELWRRLHGTETTIEKECDCGNGCYELAVEVRPGIPACGNWPFIVPIYDGHEKTSWSECAWKPSSVRA